VSKKIKLVFFSVSILISVVGCGSGEKSAQESVTKGCQLWSEFVQQDIQADNYSHDMFGPLLEAKVQIQYASENGDSSNTDARSGIAKLIGAVNDLTYSYTLKKQVNPAGIFDEEIKVTYSEIVANAQIIQTWCDVQ
jgi:hypothetical protein